MQATAFVPGHVTGFFSAHPAEDPTEAGSRGAGLALTDGVGVTVEPADGKTAVVLEDAGGDRQRMSPGSIDAVETVLETLELDAGVRLEIDADLPLGAGFGVSGAMALGTALAANAAFDRRLSENELVTIAHAADVRAGTGLGDVVAQARGGVPIRLEPGAPAVNSIDAVPARARVEYVTFGERSTADVLAGETDRLTEAGKRALSRVVSEPTLSSVIHASRRFAREADLLTPEAREAIEAVAAEGGQASMAMLGDTAFAVGTGLTDAGYDPAVCAIDPAGATLEG
ncbi:MULTISPECIES: pantoate kinase [Saliphagus]|uniref:Pantoate kinase n=1 Tax=Saliphagus infecundisoli TaxID=1849069 RepID=A0ABD5QE95_9EURY|nr:MULTISPECIES: pantoate kinase [Saliphagus]